MKRIWNETWRISSRLNTGGRPNNIEAMNKVLGGELGTSIPTLTLHSEIISRILQLRDNASFLVRPRSFVENAVKYLIRREKGEIKEALKTVY